MDMLNCTRPQAAGKAAGLITAHELVCQGGEVQCTQGFLAKEGVGGGGPASPERPDSLIDAACPARILAYPGPPRLEKDPGRVFFCDRFGIRYQDRKWMVDGLKDAYGTSR